MEAMDVAIIAVTAACTAIGSLAAGYALAVIQHRWSIRDAGKSEIITQARLAKFDAARKVNGMLRNLSHNLMRAREGRAKFYCTSTSETVTAVRELARSESYVLGEDYVSAVHRATDLASLAMEIYALDLRELKGEPALMDRFLEVRDKNSPLLRAANLSEADYLYFLYRDTLDRLSSLADYNNP
jgi:hypothetical protein